jgi:FtsZ-binding cell division protein ZapB
MRDSVQQLKESELLKVEVADLKSINSTLKNKLQEAQESLKSNENLITYLNKQLNEKPAAGANKPPANAAFKPSFTAVE